MDKELFWKVLKPVHPMAAAFCQKLTGNPEDGNDLYQDALLTAMRKFDRLRNLSAFRPWLFRIIVNSYKNSCRSRWWRRYAGLTPVLIETAAGDDPREHQDARRTLHRVLSVLSPEDRAIVVLHTIDGWSLMELADLLAKPEGTIKTRFYRAKRKMREVIERHLPLAKPGFSVNEGAYALQRCKTTDK